MSKQKVLFVCIHNSARSQMAEAFLNHLCGDSFEAQSAGLEPGKLNPLVVEVMKEEGIDISRKKHRQLLIFLKKANDLTMLLQFVMKQVQNDVLFFPD